MGGKVEVHLDNCKRFELSPLTVIRLTGSCLYWLDTAR